MPDPARILRFDRFVFHTDSGELRSGAGSVRLEPQPAKVLALLAARSGQVVSREEIQRAIWPEGTFVDFERGLNYCVAKIRTALDDSATEPRFIETLPRRGYRFLAPVDSAPTETSPPPAAFAAPATALPRARLLPPWAGFALLGVAIAGLGAAAWLGLRPERPTIAVARFDDEVGRPELDRLAQAVTDAVVVELARPPARWSVIGNAAILRTARSFRDLDAIRTALDADLIILGQVQEADGRVRVLVHLIRARDQKHLWAERFTPGPAGNGDFAEEIGRSVRAALERLGPGP